MKLCESSNTSATNSQERLVHQYERENTGDYRRQNHGSGPEGFKAVGPYNNGVNNTSRRAYVYTKYYPQERFIGTIGSITIISSYKLIE